MSRFRAYLQLMRPPNLVTAAADIVAGAVISWGWQYHEANPFSDLLELESILNLQLFWLIISSILLYGGGVVLNDFFDTDLDRVERPERPIPSGMVTRSSAAIMGCLMLLAGIGLAFMAHVKSGLIATVIAILVVLYDARAKRHLVSGPLVMGLCRAGNLLLGISVLPSNVPDLAFITVIPLVYIMGVTWISKGEVHGISTGKMTTGMAIWIVTAAMILSLGLLQNFNSWQTLPFLIIWGATTMPKLIRARRSRQPQHVGKAVKAGVLGLILVNAALAAGFGGWIFGILLLLLLPLSYLIARIYAVT